MVRRYRQWRVCDLFICVAFAEARQDDIPGEAAWVEAIDGVIAGERNEMLSSA